MFIKRKKKSSYSKNNTDGLDSRSAGTTMKRCTTGERKNTLGVTSRDILFTHQQNGRRTTQQPLD